MKLGVTFLVGFLFLLVMSEGEPDLTMGAQAYFDIDIGGQSVGKIVFALYTKQVPITTQNFMELCKGTNGVGNLLYYMYIYIYIYIYMV